MIKWHSSQGCKELATTTNQSVWCTISTIWIIPHDHLNRCRKGCRQNSAPIYDNSPESGPREDICSAKSLQSCPTLCDPIYGSPPGSPVPEIPQARTLEWVAISLSNAWKWKVKVKLLSHVWLLATPWTAAYQASPSMGFCRQEYWSGLPLPSPT